MPIYEYEDMETGVIVGLFKPVSQRDDVPPNLKRLAAPTRMSVCAGAVDDTNAAVLEGFRHVEQQIGTTELTRAVGYSPREVKRIWSEPD